MVQTNWFVITGGPGSGITTLVKAMKEHGYTIKAEVARNLILKAKKEGKNLQEYARSKQFEYDVFEQKVENESKFNTNKVLFFDRGLPDSIAYFKLAGIKTESVKYISGFRSYRKIFWLAPLDDWIPDDVRGGARQETSEEAKVIGEEIYKAYQEAGYQVDVNLIVVPVMSVEERLHFILNNIK